MKIVILDTETSGLIRPTPTELTFQPFMAEFYGIHLTENCEFVDEFETFVKMPIPMPKEAGKINGITDEMLSNAPSFFQIYEELYDFMKGADIIVGQNVQYDMGIIGFELMRHDLDRKFCYPKRYVDTIEASFRYKNKRLNLQALHELLFGEGFVKGHRARTDVMATVRCFIELVKRGDIVL